MRDVVTKLRRLLLPGRKPKISPAIYHADSGHLPVYRSVPLWHGSHSVSRDLAIPVIVVMDLHRRFESCIENKHLQTEYGAYAFFFGKADLNMYIYMYIMRTYYIIILSLLCHC